MPQVLKIGNLRTYFDGRVVVGVKYQQAVGSGVGLLGLLILSIPYYVLSFLAFASDSKKGINKAILIISVIMFVLQFIVFVLAVRYLCMAAFSDMGILPGRELEEKFIDELKDAIDEKQKSMKFCYKPINTPEPSELTLKNVKNEPVLKDNNLNSRAFKIINSTHKAETPLKFTTHDWNFTLKYCQTCRFYRPLRATHGSKSNCCIQRYDHFCAWIGTDVAYHNHGYFYLMMLFSCTFFILSITLMCLMIAISIYFLATKTGITGGKGSELYLIHILSIFCCIGGIPAASYILHSLEQLIQYHKNLSITGTLTKEDSGADNASISGPFSLFDMKKNMLLNCKGMNDDRILHKTIMSHKYLLKLVKTNPYIVNFDSLGRILKMNGFLEFQELNKEDPGDSIVKKSFRDMFEDGNEETQLINENIKFESILTVRDAVEYAIVRSKQWVILGKDDFEQLKIKRPDLFVEQGNVTRDNLNMTKMCDKSKKPAKAAPENKTGDKQSMAPLPVPSI